MNDALGMKALIEAELAKNKQVPSIALSEQRKHAESLAADIANCLLLGAPKVHILVPQFDDYADILGKIVELTGFTTEKKVTLATLSKGTYSIAFEK